VAAVELLRRLAFNGIEVHRTTTEIAVVTFLLVGAAIVVMGIIYVAARNNADNIPVPEAPA